MYGSNGNHGSNGSNNNTTASLTVKVPRSEINLVLGYLALLLSCLEHKPHGGICYKHEIVCSGSSSKFGLGRQDNQQKVGDVFGVLLVQLVF